MTKEIKWNTDDVQPLALVISDWKSNYTMTFHRKGSLVGTLDFNGPQMTFSGDIGKSARLFFELIAKSFKQRLQQEREIEREACAQVCENYTDNHGGKYADCEGHGYECAEAIRARGEK